MTDMVQLIVVSVASTGMFMLAFWLLRIVPVAQNAITTFRGGVSKMRDPGADDLVREKAVQKVGVDLIIASGSLILRSSIALAIAGVPVLLVGWAGIVPVSATLAFMQRWDVIAIASALVVVGYIVVVHLWPR